MTEILQFSGHHPFLAFCGLIAAYCAVTAPFKYAFLAYNRHCRTKNIAAHGWPTAPIDADGDVVWPKPEVEQ